MSSKKYLLVALGLFGCATGPIDGDDMRQANNPGQPEYFLIPANGYAVAPGAVMVIQAQNQQTGGWEFVGRTVATTTASEYKQKLYAWGADIPIQRIPYETPNARARVRVLECDVNAANCQPVNMYDRTGISCVYARAWEGRNDPSNLDVYDIGQACSNGRTQVELHYQGIGGGPQ
jgi:hypothetical protein